MIISKVCFHLLQFQYLEALCKELYEATDASERAAAEKALVEFSERPDCLQKCMMLLEQGSVRNCKFFKACVIS